MKNTQIFKDELLRFIKINRGYRHKTDRKTLSAFMGISDRMLRNLIADLRISGEPIISNSKNNGYWYYDKTDIDFQEAEMMIKETYSRMKKLKQMIKHIEITLYGSEQILIDFKNK